MKTAATPLRPLLLTFGALAAIAAVAWTLSPEPRAAQTAAGEHPDAQTAILADAAVEAAPIAAAPETVEPAATAAAPVRAAGEAGMKAWYDPEAGGLTSEPQVIEDRALVGEASVNPEQLPEIDMGPGWGVMVDLQGHFQESLVMTIDAQGRKVLTCTQHPGEVHVLADGPAAEREVR